MSGTGLKVSIDAQQARRIWSRLKVSGLASTPRRIQRLRRLWFDTPARDLGKASIELHLDRLGRRWAQAIFVGGALHGAQSGIQEPIIGANGGEPDLMAIDNTVLRDDLIRRVGGMPLALVCETLVRRTASVVAFDDGSRIELATITSQIMAGARSAEYREAEFRLVEGGAAHLSELVRRMLPDGGLALSRLSAVARADMLVEHGYITPPPAPVSAAAAPLGFGQETGQAARAMLEECLGQIAGNVTAVCQLDHPEGPHQLRVGLRRLRCVLLIFPAILGRPELVRLNDEARWLGRETGKLRDLDVLASEIVAEAAKENPLDPGLTALADTLIGLASEERQRLRNTLQSARAQAFLIDLACIIESWDWLDPAAVSLQSGRHSALASLATAVLAKRWRKVKKRGKRLSELDAVQRHELRKELKKLRYVGEFLAPLYPRKRTAPFLKRLKSLQSSFGKLNDAALTGRMLTDEQFPALSDLFLQRSIGWVIGASQARGESSWASAKTNWREFENTRPFWK